MTTDVLRILNTLPGSNINNLRDLKDAFTKASDITDGKKSRFETLDGLQVSGLSTEFNRIQRDLIMIKNYDIASTSVTARLEKEQKAVIDIKKQVVIFKGHISNPSLKKDDICNAALKQIQVLLNATTNNGEYLFGGIRSDVKPVQVDLTTNSNIVNNNITTNYTTSSPNTKLVTVSDLHKVEVGMAASDQAFALSIGAINRIKSGDIRGQVDMDKAMLLLDGLIMKTGLAKDQVESATEYNVAVKTQAVQDIDSTFTIGLEEAGRQFLDAKNSLLLGQKVTVVTSRLFAQLLEM